MNTVIRILIADDHRMMADGLAHVFSDTDAFAICGMAANGREAITLAEQQQPDIILMDIDMPVVNGLEATAHIRKTNPAQKIIVLTMHDERTLLQAALSAGANGIVLKIAGADELLAAVKAVSAGEKYISSEVRQTLEHGKENSSGFTSTASGEQLTTREIEIITLIADGLTNSEIGDKLFISPRTVDTHRTNIFRKLGVANAAELIRYAFKNKLIR